MDAKSVFLTQPLTTKWYTEEQKEIMNKRKESRERAIAFLTKLYNEKTAVIIVANTMTTYNNVFKKWADSFEQAWETLDDEIVDDIIYRAVNDLPARNKKDEVEA